MQMENICFANDTQIKFVFNHVDAILAGQCNKLKSNAYGSYYYSASQFKFYTST